MSGTMITVKMMRGEPNSSWGFRLQGGKDWGIPLSVSKINPGSLAEQGGLEIGDYILKIGGRDADGMMHKEAQDMIIRSGNNLEVTVQRGGTSTWRPQVTKIGNIDSSQYRDIQNNQTFTKTSLAKNPRPEERIGSGHNMMAKPFSPTQQKIPALVHKQFNSPLNVYSMNNIAEAIQAHSEVLAPGVKGINFMKPDAPVNRHSAVYQAIMDEEQGRSSSANQREDMTGTHSPSLRRVAEDVGQSSPSPVIGTQHVESSVTKPASERKDGGGNKNICAECGRLIVGVFCRIKDKSLHAECFKCATCGTNLKNVGYFNVNDKLYCDVHAKQAASMMAGPFEGIHDTGSPSLSSPTMSMSGATKINTPQPGSGRISPSVLGPSPWQGTPSPSGVHHVSSPRASPTAAPLEKVPPPVAPKPQGYKQSPGAAPFHPYTGPTVGVHRQTTDNQAKFTWPPSKIGMGGDGGPMPGQYDQSTRTTAYRTVQGPEQSMYESQKMAGDPNMIHKPYYFSCVHCKQPFGNKTYHLEEGLAYCRKDWLELFSAKCVACGQPIDVYDRCVEAMNNHYHSQCFNCSVCNRNLEGSGFYAKGGRPFCKSHAR